MLTVFCNTADLQDVKEELTRSFPGCFIGKAYRYDMGKVFNVSRSTKPLVKHEVLGALESFSDINVIEST